MTKFTKENPPVAMTFWIDKATKERLKLIAKTESEKRRYNVPISGLLRQGCKAVIQHYEGLPEMGA